MIKGRVKITVIVKAEGTQGSGKTIALDQIDRFLKRSGWEPYQSTEHERSYSKPTPAIIKAANQ